MSKIRNSVLALAAIASIGAAALMSSISSADARGFGGGFSRSGGAGFHGGMNRGFRQVGGRHFGGYRFHGRHNWHHRRHWHVRWHRPWIYGVGSVGVAGLATTAYAAAPRPCTCLTKEYTQDNVVVFKDLCTKETAAAPIGGQQSQLQPGDVEPVPQK